MNNSFLTTVFLIYLFRCSLTLHYSIQSQQCLCNALLANAAVIALEPDNKDSRKGIGVLLYLITQGSTKPPFSRPTEWIHKIRVRAYEEFLIAQKNNRENDWTCAYYCGKLSWKLGKVDVCLEHLFLAACANSEDETLGVEPLYKLHSTRSKLSLSKGCDLDLLRKYSLEICMSRNLNEGISQKFGIEKPCVDVSKQYPKACKEQDEFQNSVGSNKNSSLTDDQLLVLRDAMIAMRIAINTNKKYCCSRYRYRLAWLMKQYIQDDKQESANKEMADNLNPIFFSDKGDLHAAGNIERRLSNYLKDSDEESVASWSNLHTHIRQKNKLITFLGCVLRHSSFWTVAIDKIDKLLDSLLKEERIRSKYDNSVKKSHSVMDSIQNLVQNMYDTIVQISLQNDTESLNVSFMKAGKLRELLYNADKEIYSRLQIDVSLQVSSADKAKPVFIESIDCPVTELFGWTCKRFCESTNTPYNETGTNSGKGVLCTAVGIWKGKSYEKRIRPLQSQKVQEPLPAIDTVENEEDHDTTKGKDANSTITLIELSASMDDSKNSPSDKDVSHADVELDSESNRDKTNINDRGMLEIQDDSTMRANAEERGEGGNDNLETQDTDAMMDVSETENAMNRSIVLEDSSVGHQIDSGQVEEKNMHDSHVDSEAQNHNEASREKAISQTDADETIVIDDDPVDEANDKETESAVDGSLNKDLEILPDQAGVEARSGQAHDESLTRLSLPQEAEDLTSMFMLADDVLCEVSIPSGACGGDQLELKDF